ncbi:MAG: mechanosensitive ion channel [Chloroflexia bacterium]|nr:mechanosensitive ion channel [Chloroflexia bacterium]
MIKKGIADVSRRTSIFQLTKYFIWVISLSIMFQAIGFSLSIFLAGSAALLVGIGLGLQQIFNDLISGLFILFEGTIKVGDIMEVDGIVGKVEKIQLRSTEFLSRDGMNIIVPNHKFITENVINWSFNNSFKRFDIEVGVAYGTDLEKVKNVLIACAASHPEVINADQAMHPLVRLVAFGDSSINFQLLFWSKNIFRIENTRSDLRFAIDKAFKENSINIPFPQRDIHIKGEM